MQECHKGGPQEGLDFIKWQGKGYGKGFGNKGRGKGKGKGMYGIDDQEWPGVEWSQQWSKWPPA